ncbi:MAG TPA: hypothetical protein VGL76_12035 [Gaiellaceae bacterium]
MRLAGRLTLLSLVAVLAACGSSHARRNAVNTYFDQVNAAESRLLASVGEIDGTFKAFSLTSNKQVEVKRLAQAQVEIGSALARVRALDPPPDAAKVHADLVRLLTLQHDVAHELYWTTQFEPLYMHRLNAVSAVANMFIHDLNQVGAPVANGKPPKLSLNTALDGYATAFTTYGAALKPIVATLDRMSAPPELRPGFLAQRAALDQSVTLSATISTALHARKVAAANEAIRKLFESAASANGTEAEKAIRGAVRAYEARLGQIAKLAAQVSRERQKLVTRLG